MIIHVTRNTLSTSTFTLALIGLLVGVPAAASAAPDQTLVDLVNQQRAQNGCRPVTQNPQLAAAAQRHADDLANGANFSHTGSDGSNFEGRIASAGYGPLSAAGEIIYQGPTQQSAVNAWMNSPGHKAIMLDCSYSDVGMATAFNDGTMYAVGNFAIH